MTGDCCSESVSLAPLAMLGKGSDKIRDIRAGDYANEQALARQNHSGAKHIKVRRNTRYDSDVIVVMNSGRRQEEITQREMMKAEKVLR